MPNWELLQPVLYLWLKAAHVIFVIFWIAGLFMLPRFYVYHQEAEPGSAEAARWIVREGKLRSIILNPAMALVWLFGLLIAFMGPDQSFAYESWFTEGWLHAKLLLVVLLSAYHGYMVGYGRKLAAGTASKSGRSLRLMNEVPGIVTVVVVILVIVKPF